MNKLKIELSVEQWNIVLGGLAELPFRVSAEVIAEIKKQGDSANTPEGPLADKVVQAD